MGDRLDVWGMGVGNGAYFFLKLGATPGSAQGPHAVLGFEPVSWLHLNLHTISLSLIGPLTMKYFPSALAISPRIISLS